MEVISNLWNLEFYTKQNDNGTYAIYFESDSKDKHYIFKVKSENIVDGELMIVSEKPIDKTTKV